MIFLLWWWMRDLMSASKDRPYYPTEYDDTDGFYHDN